MKLIYACMITALALLSSGVPANEVVAQDNQNKEGGPREGTFTARWVVSGTWRGMKLGGDREAIIARMSGNLNVAADSGRLVDLWSNCLIFWDSQTGGTGRCRWSHPSGDEAFSEIEGALLSATGSVRGRFVGGTGRYEGLQGEFTVPSWDSFQLDRQRRTTANLERGGLTFNAYTREMSGTWRLP